MTRKTYYLMRGPLCTPLSRSRTRSTQSYKGASPHYAQTHTHKHTNKSGCIKSFARLPWLWSINIQTKQIRGTTVVTVLFTYYHTDIFSRQIKKDSWYSMHFTA